VTYPVISALRRWLQSPPSAEPFEPYARALNDHWTQRRRVRFYIRGRYGPFRRMNSAQGFEALRQRRHLEDIALAACKGRVLDAGAGAGRHSLLLRDAGLEVVSIDIEPTLVDLMRRRGLREVYQADVFEFDGGVFDTVLFLQETIGLVGSLGRLPELLLRLRQQLVPGGRILLDSNAPRETCPSTDYSGEVELQLRYGSLIGKPFRWLYVDFSVLRVCAASAGFDAEILACGTRPRDYLACLTPRR